MNLKGLVSQRNICFATRPMGDHAKYGRTGLALCHPAFPINRHICCDLF